jgi:hypothetical protein
MTAETYPNSIWRRLYYSRWRDVLRGRLDARLDWRQSIALADLPENLADMTTQVVRRTRLWRGEKVDVANDLIAHFQDGLEFGHSPDELLKSFGDPQAAAQLIRRAKRRNRPLSWHLLRYCLLGLVALVAMYVSMGVWQSFGRPTIRTDYLAVVNKVPAAVPESERAWPVYRIALAELGFNNLEDGSPAKAFLDSDAKPGQEGWTAREKFLTDHADAIVKLGAAAGRKELGFVASTSQAGFSETDREFFGFKVSSEQIEAAKQAKPEDRWIIGTHLPHMVQLRDAARALAADARRAAKHDDGDTAYANVVAMLGVSRHAEEMPFLVCLLVAEAIQQQARDVIRDVLADHAAVWSDEQLRDLAHQFAATRTDWARGIEGERISFYDSMQRTYTDNGNGDGRLALQVTPDQNLFQMLDAVTEGKSAPSIFENTGVAMVTLPAANMFVASRKEMVDLFDKITNDVQANIDQPYWKRSAKPSWDNELKALTNGPVAKFRYLFVNLLVPAYDRVQNRVMLSDGERDGVFLGLALELYHRQHKKWPESLAELSPQYLPQLPVDPITGKPLQYKVVDDKPLVYSVGFDRDDDAGRPVAKAEEQDLWTNIPSEAPPIDGDWVLWSLSPASGGDRKAL